MKHDWPTTLTLTAIFLVAQAAGIGTAAYAHAQVGADNVGEPPGVGERPEQTGLTGILIVLAGIAISTTAILYLAKNNVVWAWQAWFTVASFIALYLTASVFLPAWLAAITAAAVAATRSLIRHPVTHNAVEIAMYAGIALFLAPLFNVTTATILLAIMAAYDIYAVNKSQHMVTLAEFTRDTDLFPGVNLTPQSSDHSSEQRSNDGETTSGGVLGGGDILFPLLFSETVFFAAAPTSIAYAAAYAGITTIGATAGLLALFLASRQGRYYPALPFLTTGSLTGLLIVQAINVF